MAWLKVVTPQNISVGFNKAGFWPFHPDVVKQGDMLGGGTHSAQDGEEDGNGGDNESKSDERGGDDTGKECR